MASQSLWRGVRTAVAVLVTAGLSIAALYTWFIHKQTSKDKRDRLSEKEEEEEEGIKEESVKEGDAGQEEEEEGIKEESVKEGDAGQEKENSLLKEKVLKEASKEVLKNEEVDVFNASGDNKEKVKPAVPSELPDLEITTKIVDNNEAKQPEKSPDIPVKVRNGV